tara:strand:- start:31 stop:468 length:438 start_codon:yes stop_codon:yes gene_type:complete
MIIFDKTKIMKRLLLVVFLFQSFIGISQTEKTSTLPTSDSEMFVWKDGEENYVDVKFSYLVPKEIVIEQDILGKVVMKIMVNSQYKLKNKISYIPKKLTIIYSEEDGTYSGICNYWGKNSYGVKSESTTYYSFTLDGEIKEIMTL